MQSIHTVNGDTQALCKTYCFVFHSFFCANTFRLISFQYFKLFMAPNIQTFIFSLSDQFMWGSKCSTVSVHTYNLENSIDKRRSQNKNSSRHSICIELRMENNVNVFLSIIYRVSDVWWKSDGNIAQQISALRHSNIIICITFSFK